MKLNEKELASYAQSANGKADKEGILWIKEYDGKSKKREVLTRRWFKLIGNLLFYLKSDVQSSPVFGLIILLKSYVEVDRDNSKMQYSFRLTFEQDTTTIYYLAAENPQDMVEWILALRSVGYEYLLDVASNLRAKIFHLTSKDPIPQGNPLAHRRLRSISELPPAVSTVTNDEPLLNLSIGCSSLVSPRKTLPSSLVVTNTRTPPQSYWSKMAQTEIVENKCDPQFFTSVILSSGSTLTTTELRFEVFDVEDRNGSKMYPIGVAHCTVRDILQSPSYQTRLKIIQGEAVQGYLSLLAWKENQSPDIMSPTTNKEDNSLSFSGFENWRRESKSSSLRLPFNRLIMTNFQFPVAKDSEEAEKIIKVSEVMGEGIYSWTIPKQMLDIYISENNKWLGYYQSLNVLKEDWEITRQEIMLEHSEMISYYRSELSGMEQEQAKGVTFKKSTEKGAAGYEFIPTNLHVQYLRVEVDSQHPPSIAYEVVSVGAPTAYGLRSKSGGLMRWHLTHPFSLANHYSDAACHDNPTAKGKAILVQLDQSLKSIHEYAQELLDACDTHQTTQIQDILFNLTSEVYRLQSNIDIALVNKILIQWKEVIQEGQSLPWALTHKNLTVSLLFDHMNAKLSNLSGKITSLDFMKTNPGELTTSWRTYIHEPLSIFLNMLMDIAETLQKSIYFLFLKEAHSLACEKVQEGLKGYRHRRDICFTHAVTTLTTSFVTKLRQLAANESYGNQLIHVGFLVYWESYLSTHGDEITMLEDFYVAVQDLNSVTFTIVCDENGTLSQPKVTGSRYHVSIVVPLEDAIFQLLPFELQAGHEISVCVVLINLGINEQQSLADRIGDNTLQEIINLDNHRTLKHYILRFRDVFALADAKWKQKLASAESMCEDLLPHIQSRKHKNTAIIYIMQRLSRVLNAARVTSCKSAKDRTSMAVTLEQANILVKEYNMEQSVFQQALDSMRSQGTRLQNCMKNVGHPLYAFNVLQVTALPRNFRPPDGTYRKLPT